MWYIISSQSSNCSSILFYVDIVVCVNYMQGVIALFKCMDVLTREDGSDLMKMAWWRCVDGVVGGQRTMGIWFWYSPLRNSQLIWLTHDGPEVCAKNWTELVFTVATLPCHAYFCALSCLQSARVRGRTTFCCIVSLGCVLLFSSNNDGSLSHCCVCKLYAGWIALFKCLCGCTETFSCVPCY